MISPAKIIFLTACWYYIFYVSQAQNSALDFIIGVLYPEFIYGPRNWSELCTPKNLCGLPRRAKDGR